MTCCECLDDKLHLECFVCSVCEEPIKGKFFKDKETGKFLCISDYQALNQRTYSSSIQCVNPDFQARAEKCFKCELPILERFTIVKENKFHPECFRFCVYLIMNINFENCLLQMWKVWQEFGWCWIFWGKQRDRLCRMLWPAFCDQMPQMRPITALERRRGGRGGD